jgi:hypothetical protein
MEIRMRVGGSEDDNREGTTLERQHRCKRTILKGSLIKLSMRSSTMRYNIFPYSSRISSDDHQTKSKKRMQSFPSMLNTAKRELEVISRPMLRLVI